VLLLHILLDTKVKDHITDSVYITVNQN